MENREEIGYLTLSQCDAKDVLSYFSPEDLLDEIETDDIVSYLEHNGDILEKIDDDKLIEAVTFESSLIESIETEDMIQCLENEGYKVIDEIEDEIYIPTLDRIKQICRELKPTGYIGKEEAKEIISDFIDTWQTSSF